MKRSNKVSSSRRKQRLRHFSAPSSVRRTIMSCLLVKELREKHGVRTLPVRKGDEVKIKLGNHRGKSGKVVQVYRKRWCIYVDKIQRDKQNGQTVFIPIKPNKCVIEKLHLNKDRKAKIETINNNKSKSKNKYQARDVNMAGVN